MHGGAYGESESGNRRREGRQEPQDSQALRGGQGGKRKEQHGSGQGQSNQGNDDQGHKVNDQEGQVRGGEMISHEPGGGVS